MNTEQVTQSSALAASSKILKSSSDQNGKKANGFDNLSSSQEASTIRDFNKSSSSSTTTLASSKGISSSSMENCHESCEASQKSNQGTTISSVSSDKASLSTDAAMVQNYRYSRTHQRRFHRRFPAIDPQEKVIDWYSCALVEDILIQGYLYISENYFAFYSNLIVYKTQVRHKVVEALFF